MRAAQRGVGLGGLVLVLFIVIVVAIFGFKLIPAYLQYGKARNAIQAIAADRASSSSVSEVRKAFERRATIDDIDVIKSEDLDVAKEGGDVVISFGYRKEIPLFANIGLYIDFAASSKP